MLPAYWDTSGTGATWPRRSSGHRRVTAHRGCRRIRASVRRVRRDRARPSRRHHPNRCRVTVTTSDFSTLLTRISISVAPECLIGVGERFTRREVRVAFDLLRQLRASGQLVDDLSRDGAARRRRFEGRDQPAIEQDGRGESTRQRAEFFERILRLLHRLGDEGSGFVGVVIELAVGGGEIHLHANESLLRSVVDVTLEPPQGVTLGRARRTARLVENRVPAGSVPRTSRHRERRRRCPSASS